YRDFLLEDYRVAAGDLTVDKFVHVSATTKPRAYLDEAAWVASLADDAGLDMGLIGTVDPTLPTHELLADLESQASSPRFRGIRVLAGLEPHSDPAATILSWLDERGHIFDLVTAPAQMTEWLRTLADYSHLTVVLEHTGWPAGTDDTAHADWRAGLEAFASATTGPCKDYGLG